MAGSYSFAEAICKKSQRTRPASLRQVVREELLPKATMKNPMLFLAAAIVCEVLWAVMMKVGQGVALRWASVVMALAYVLSLVCLNAACRKLDLSLAYAVWTGASDCLPPPNQSVISRRGRSERLGPLPWARRG